MISKTKKNHNSFLSHLDDSTHAVFKVALLMHKKGYDIRINGLKKAKAHKEWKNFKDEGDLFVKIKGIEKRIEVKALSASFTDSTNWPFNNKFIVCAKHSFEGCENRPSAYIILNKEQTHAAYIDVEKTESHWYTESRVDTRYQDISQEFYFCPINLVKWKNL